MYSSASTDEGPPLTELIERIDQGDAAAKEDFCARVYDELKAIARRQPRRSDGDSLATTDVVHEFLGKLLADGRLGQMKSRRYFFATAVGQMQNLLVDHWRERRRKKRGGDAVHVDLDACLDQIVDSAAERCGGDLEALNEALETLKEPQRTIVQLLFFGGLTQEQAAAELDLSEHQVKRQWRIARARLELLLHRPS